MGIEFQCRFDYPASGSAVERVLYHIATLPGLIPLDAMGAVSKLRLRFADIQEQKTWPEDMSIELTPKECYVVFYNGEPNKW